MPRRPAEPWAASTVGILPAVALSTGLAVLPGLVGFQVKELLCDGASGVNETDVFDV